MKGAFPEIVERSRMTVGEYGTSHGETFGFFFIQHPRTRIQLKVMVGDGAGWDHVSVSNERRCPTWDEMCWVKHLFFRSSECVMQLHVPGSDHVNVHTHCLHLWRPHDESLIPRPPKIMVG